MGVGQFRYISALYKPRAHKLLAWRYRPYLQIMKNLTYLLVLTILTLSCNSNKNLDADIELMKSLEERVYRTYEANAELASYVEDSDEIRELLNDTFYNLGQMEEHSIAASGGYKHVEPLGDRRNILNSELRDAPNFIRNNPYGIDVNYLNRISEYLETKGLTIGYSFKNPSDDPNVGSDPEIASLDYFDVAFANRNIFQILTVFHEIKLEMLHQERTYLQSQLEECNKQNDSL